jgi:hypothetical protein
VLALRALPSRGGVIKKSLSLVLLGATLQAYGSPESLIDKAAQTVGAPSVSSPLAPDNVFQVQATSGASNATIKASLKRSAANYGFSTFSIIGQAPISKGGGDTTLASLDGLANGTTVELRYANYTLLGRRKDGAGAALNQCQTNDYEVLFRKIPGNEKAERQCDEGRVKSLVGNKALGESALKESDYDTFEQNFYSPDAAVHSFGISAKGGYQDFTYYDTSSLAQARQRNTISSVSGFYAFMPMHGLSAVTATLSVQSVYKDAKSKTVCFKTPPSGGAFLTCASGSIGEPTRKITQVLNLEWRRQIADKLAISVQVSHDFKNEVSEVQVPVYLIADSKNSLSGGLSFGWTSTDHKGVLGVFVGQSFSIF